MDDLTLKILTVREALGVDNPDALKAFWDIVDAIKQMRACLEDGE